VLLWIGHQYLKAYQSPTLGATYRDKLTELLASSENLDKLFASLWNLKAPTVGPDLFSKTSPVFKGLISSRGTFSKNDFGMRRAVFQELRNVLGIDKFDSIPILSDPSKATSKVTPRKSLKKVST
jgi:hypothetical protein